MRLEPVILSVDEAGARRFIGKRLDVAIAAMLERSRNHAQSLLKRNLVELRPHPEKAEPSYRLRAGDRVVISFPDDAADEENGPEAEAIPLEVIYEDEALLAINKQAGLVVHPAVGHRSGTLVNALAHRAGKSTTKLERMGIVHRLDKDTSGVLLIAKTGAAQERLAAAFAQRQVRKLYRALCWGAFRARSGSCREAIGRHRVHRQKMTVLRAGGRAAHTEYRVLEQGRLGAEVECILHTGRTHQIRVHLAHLNHPVWGDATYGRPHPLPDGFKPPRQMLHAARIEIVHPLTGRTLELEAPPPGDYRESRRRLLYTE
jgi:23S rRNA pseudouridine1911/1915/1917 synthase